MTHLPKVLILVDKNDGSLSANCFDGTWEYLLSSLDKLAAVTRPKSLDAAGELLASGNTPPYARTYSSVNFHPPQATSPPSSSSHQKHSFPTQNPTASSATRSAPSPSTKAASSSSAVHSALSSNPQTSSCTSRTWKLPWTTGDYHRTTFSVNPVFKVQAADPNASYRFDVSTAELEKEYSQKVLHVKGAPRSAAVYVTTPDSRVESRVFPPNPAHDPVQAPAVFQAYGKGYVGYLGDVNGEEGTSKAILALCGLTSNTSPPTVSQGIPNPTAGGAYCSGCGEQEPPVGQGERYQRCGKCQKCYYCSRKCQKDHWDGGHKKNCKYMRDEDTDEEDDF